MAAFIDALVFYIERVAELEFEDLNGFRLLAIFRTPRFVVVVQSSRRDRAFGVEDQRFTDKARKVISDPARAKDER